jgi:hypothetical protein
MTSNPDGYGPILRHEWLAHLRDLGDLELQRHTWLNLKNTNPHWSYVEFVCSFPDDGQLDAGLNEGWLQAGELRILRDFRKILVAYDSPTGSYDHNGILADPAWQQVVKAAHAACVELLAIVEDPNGRSALLDRQLPF